MADTIQDDYRVSQQVGMVGQPSRPGQSLGENIITIGATIPQPGQAYVLAAGVAELPADQTAAALAVGVVSFSDKELNSAITKTVNHQSGVVYADGDVVPGVTDGHIYVLAGGAIAEGDPLIYNTVTDKWIVGVTTKAAFIADVAGVDGDIISVQVNRIG